MNLASSLNLTDWHKQVLTKEIKAVYGEVEVIYEESKTLNRAGSKLQNRVVLQNMAEEGTGVFHTAISPRLDGEIYLEELDQNSAWHKIRQKLRQHFGDDIDKSWFSKLTSIEEKESGKILLKAPTKFIKDWINNNYSTVIAQYCKLVTGLELGFDRVGSI